MSTGKKAVMDAVKVAVAAFATVYLEPFLSSWIPKAPVAVPFLISAVVSAVLIQVLLTVVIGRYPVRVAWETVADRTPLTGIQLRFNGPGEHSGIFILTVFRPQMGWLTEALTKVLIRRGLELQLVINAAPVYISVMQGTRAQSDDRRLVRETGAAGITIEMTDLPGEGVWRFGEVVFNSRDMHADLPHSISYQWVTKDGNRAESWWAHRVLKITPDVKTIRVVGV